MRRRIAATVVTLAVLGSATVATAAVLRTEGPAVDAAAMTDTAADTRRYYASARAALSPLIQHVRDLPAALIELGERNGNPQGLRSRGLEWAEDCANARDLIGRLPGPGGPAGSHVAVLYQSAAMLYTEAARMMASAAGAGSVAQRRADALLGTHVLAIADRLFDSAFRLLNSTGALAAGEMHFPGPVPDFASSPTGALAPKIPETAAVPLAAWTVKHGPSVHALADSVAGALAGTSAVSAAELTRMQNQLVEPVDDIAAQESITGLRLATILLIEARNPQQSDGVTRRVDLVAARVWVSSAGLLPDRALQSAAAAVSPKSDETVLFEGGHFDGDPPGLRPGDDPGAGLPGGLPELDAAELLGG